MFDWSDLYNGWIIFTLGIIVIAILVVIFVPRTKTNPYDGGDVIGSGGLREIMKF